MRAAGRLLVAEPAGHVKIPDYDETLAAAEFAGFEIVSRPKIRRSHAALLAPRT
jgi:hypothetical protein